MVFYGRNLVSAAMLWWGGSAYCQTQRYITIASTHQSKVAFEKPLLRISACAVAVATAVTLSGGSISFAAPLASPLQDAKKFEHSYYDRLHPACTRRITVEETPSGTILAHFDGTDVGEKGTESLHGCSKNEIQRYRLRYWNFDGAISGDDISGGDGVHEGKWDTNGISWNDGNKWTVVSSNGGGGAFVAYAWFLISVYAGVKGAVDKFKETNEAQ